MTSSKARFPAGFGGARHSPQPVRQTCREVHLGCGFGPLQDVRYELEKAAAIRAWCLRDLRFGEGDRVRIARTLNTDNGWRSYREALAVGATATVREIDFNRYSLDGVGAWQADIMLDREWSYSPDLGKRWWNGPADETPEGMEPPSEFDRKKYPEGRRHLFSVLVTDLEPIDHEDHGECECGCPRENCG